MGYQSRENGILVNNRVSHIIALGKVSSTMEPRLRWVVWPKPLQPNMLCKALNFTRNWGNFSGLGRMKVVSPDDVLRKAIAGKTFGLRVSGFACSKEKRHKRSHGPNGSARRADGW